MLNEKYMATCSGIRKKKPRISPGHYSALSSAVSTGKASTATERRTGHGVTAERRHVSAGTGKTARSPCTARGNTAVYGRSITGMTAGRRVVTAVCHIAVRRSVDAGRRRAIPDPEVVNAGRSVAAAICIVAGSRSLIAGKWSVCHAVATCPGRRSPVAVLPVPSPCRPGSGRGEIRPCVSLDARGCGISPTCRSDTDIGPAM